MDWVGVGFAREEAGLPASDEFLDGGGGNRGIATELGEMEVVLGGGGSGWELLDNEPIRGG